MAQKTRSKNRPPRAATKKAIRRAPDGHHIPTADAERRRALGIYYTPDRLARVLADWAIRDAKNLILEPSFGGCSMLSAAVAKLKELGATEPQHQLFGCDVDPTAFVHLKKIVARPSTKNFLLGDFLETHSIYKGKQVDAVIGNPPFVSYHRMDHAQRKIIDAWRDKYPVSFPKSASLWAYFLAHAQNFLVADARLAFVLPAAFNTADYAKPLAEKLASRFNSVRVFDIAEQMFLEAGTRERTVVLLADGYSAQKLENKRVQRLSVPTLEVLKAFLDAGEIANQPAAPVAHDDDPIDRALPSESFFRLRDVATVSIGEVVGDTSFFVKSAATWATLKIPNRFLVPLVTRGKQVNGLLAKTTDVWKLYSPVPMLLRAPQKRLPKTIVNYLASYPTKLRNSNRTFQKRDPWHVTTYRTDSAAFIGSLSHKGPRMLINKAKISCSNGLYQIRPIRRPGWTNTIAAASLSTPTQLSAELLARARGPGALKLEPSDVLQLAFPRSALSLDRKAASAFVTEVDRLIRTQGLAAASRYVDKVLLIDTTALSHHALRSLEDSTRELRTRRMHKRIPV